MAVAVPHAVLAQVVELASGSVDRGNADPRVESLEALYDVAALARRYNRAPPTVRQWFHDGLFGPPAERRFRGRGYVASAHAVREFETRTGLKAVGDAQEDCRTEFASPVVDVKPSVSTGPGSTRSRRSVVTAAGIGGKIFAEALGGRAQRTARKRSA